MRRTKEIAELMVNVVLKEEEIEVKEVTYLPEDVERETWRRLEEEEAELDEDEERLMRASFDAMKELIDYPAFSFAGKIYLKHNDLEKLGQEVRQRMDGNLHRRLCRQGLFRTSDLELGLFTIFHEIQHTMQTEREIKVDRAKAQERAYGMLSESEQEYLEDLIEEMTIEDIEKLFRQGNNVEDKVLEKFALNAEEILHEEMETEVEADEFGAEMVFALRQVPSNVTEEEFDKVKSYIKEVV